MILANVIYSLIVLATVITIVNNDYIVITIVNYDRKTFIVLATDVVANPIKLFLVFEIQTFLK